MGTELSGTKEIIFDVALKLAAEHGFDNISMREIAEETGIKASSIYNHYPGKEAILDAFYNYYDEHKYDGRKNIDEVKEVIRRGTAYDIIKAVAYDYWSLPKKTYIRIILLTKVVFMRMFSDSRASRIFFEIFVTDNAEYVSKLMDYGISIGRLEPFDTATFGDFITTQLCFMGIKAYAASDYIVSETDEKEKIINLLAKMLPVTDGRK